MSITIKLPYHIDSYTIDTNCEDIVNTLRSLYGTYCSDSADGSIVISVSKPDDKYTINWNDRKFITAEPMGCVHNIIYNTKKITTGIFAMHAGAVCRNRKASIFAASTTTGKTTLISYLTQSGFEYVSDDCVFIDMDDLSVYPLHNPLHLRDGGAEILRKCGKLPNDLTYADERYIFVPQNLSPEKTEIEKIYFINRTNNENTILPLDRKDSFKRLMFSPIVTYNITPEYMRFLNKLTPFCHTLRYTDMGYVMDQIK